ncbi:alpha/beta hydrolase [Mycolicibacterium flavescens]|uniref:Hydrolase n=1 Tax=Mycolicibacterium flavescens TaxID=1776 RepID=A0A1E3RHJ4_MYCFV|nr:alpha/beta hydrolase [Mycolicibacterium flavescens]MCV7280243.1 alpha/beta hydrolase [Mycolicibacterium flavescens]ODQ89331.1 hydrolase [Mycolicibacterium flavescens]
MTTATVVLDDARIEYTDTGAGSPVVFVHGAYVTGALWDDVIASLAPHHRCIAPTWPFGAQRQPVGDGVDVGVVAAGRRIIALLDELDLRDVTLVANDSGGGIVLSALGILGLDWSRVSRLVFTNCDSFEHFPPKSFAPLVKLCRASGTAGALALRALATPPGLAFFKRAVTENGIASERDPAIFGGFLRSGEVRRDAVRFSAALNPRHTAAAAPAIEKWSKPVLLVWGTEDDLFPVSHAERLAGAFPHATLRLVEGSSTYVMLDRPAETASAIAAFIAGPS